MKRKEIDLGAAFEKDSDLNDLKKEIFDEAMNVRIEYERSGSNLDKENIIYYTCTNYRSAAHEVGILWNDKDLKIRWPIKNPILSKKDKRNLTFKQFQKK